MKKQEESKEEKQEKKIAWRHIVSGQRGIQKTSECLVFTGSQIVIAPADAEVSMHDGALRIEAHGKTWDVLNWEFVFAKGPVKRGRRLCSTIGAPKIKGPDVWSY